MLVSDDGTTQTHNLLGLNLIHQDDGSHIRTLLADGLGSVRVEMVGSAIDSATTYEPYGKLLARSGPSGTVYGYTAEQHDAATGLVYLRARYYNPALKLFMSVDPFPGWQTLPASQHGYSYVHNNPGNFIDPTGEVAWFVPIIAAGAIYGVGYLAYDFFAPQNLTTSDWQWWLGSFTGYENIRYDISVMYDPCASTGQKVWAGVDAVWNAALGMSMVHGAGGYPDAQTLSGKCSQRHCKFMRKSGTWGRLLFQSHRIGM
jgi:RHS repeat-associated protein